MKDVTFFKQRFIVKFMNILNNKYIHISIYIYIQYMSQEKTKQMHGGALKK